jgi:hypothetical protein
MSLEQNLAAIERLLTAVWERDEDAFAAAYADDALVRQSGVPASMGGVLRGRNEILENFRRQDPWSVDTRLMFGDETHVCVVGKLSGVMTGSQALRGNNLPFSAYECAVYTIGDGLIQEQTMFVNWLDPYVQAGLVDISTLRA